MLLGCHYENTPMQYTEMIFSCKFDIFNNFAQNIDYWYTLEPPCRRGSNVYPQSMFKNKNKTNMYTPPFPTIAI